MWEINQGVGNQAILHKLLEKDGRNFVTVIITTPKPWITNRLIEL